MTNEEIAAEIVATGIGINTARRRYKFGGPREANIRKIVNRLRANRMPEVTMPEFPSEVESADELLDRLCTGYDRRNKAAEAREWFPVSIDFPGPVGIVFIGDPHMDNPGCDIIALRRDVELIRDTPGVYSVPIGDYGDNWVGRLSREYAKSDVSTKQLRVLIEWLIRSCKPLVMVRGNHDLWLGEGDPVNWISQGAGVPVAEWSAKFRVVLPGGEFRIHAAHNFPGHSQWNNLHGNIKAAKFSGFDADIYVSGHTHNNGVMMQGGKALIKVAGYKRHDAYATQLGCSHPNCEQSVMVILDPAATDPTERVLCFSSVPLGVRVLRAMRAGQEKSTRNKK